MFFPSVKWNSWEKNRYGSHPICIRKANDRLICIIHNLDKIEKANDRSKGRGATYN